MHLVPWIKGSEQWLGNTPLAAASTSSVSTILADWGDGLTDNAHIVFHGDHILTESNLLSNVDIMTGAQSSWMRDVAIVDRATATDEIQPTKSVVFIDTSVADPAAIVAATDASAEIVYLYADQDGLGQIADYLAGRTGIDNIQIVNTDRNEICIT